MKAAEDLFAGETFPQLLQTMQTLDQRKTQEENLNIKNPEDKTQPGKNGGLTVIIDTNKNSMSPASLSVDTGGIIGMIEPGNSYPVSNLASIDIKTGYNTLIALSGSVTSTSKDLISKKSKDRKCLFEQEKANLTIFQHYSQSNCFFECFLSYTFPTADLLPKICDPWEAVEFRYHQMNKFVNTADKADTLGQTITDNINQIIRKIKPHLTHPHLS
jgi:hypothetical protein